MSSENQHPAPVTPSVTPAVSQDTLRHQLDIQWRDHFQTREQTWKTLQTSAALLISYIAAGFQVGKNPWFILAGGSVCFLASVFGAIITLHHRKVQIRKFKFIYGLEQQLGLHRSDLLGEVEEPKPFTWTLAEVFDFKRMASPTFILLMHIALMALTVAYVVGRFCSTP